MLFFKLSIHQKIFKIKWNRKNEIVIFNHFSINPILLNFIFIFWTLYSIVFQILKNKKYEFPQKYQAAKTVFNIDNNNKCFLSAKTLPSHKYISF